jgi:hypothetical protein
MQQIIEGLEEKIDPFDLDVFSPYIQSHLMKQAQRSSVSIIMDYVLHIRGRCDRMVVRFTTTCVISAYHH